MPEQGGAGEEGPAAVAVGGEAFVGAEVADVGAKEEAGAELVGEGGGEADCGGAFLGGAFRAEGLDVVDEVGGGEEFVFDEGGVGDQAVFEGVAQAAFAGAFVRDAQRGFDVQGEADGGGAAFEEAPAELGADAVEGEGVEVVLAGDVGAVAPAGEDGAGDGEVLGGALG